jgi:CubicO group peptidase (beta-lactamase class C family)
LPRGEHRGAVGPDGLPLENCSLEAWRPPILLSVQLLPILRILACACALLGFSPHGAEAVDHLVAGTKLDVSDIRQMRSGIAKTKRSLSFRSRDASIVLPAPGDAADPSVHGGRLTLINSAGTGESVTLELPAEGWSVKGTGGAVTRLSYVSRKPKVQVTLRPGDIKVKTRDKTGRDLPFTLDEASQGGLAVVLELGSDRFCGDFGGAAGGLVRADLGSVDGACNVRGRYSAQGAAAPAACADPSAGNGLISQGQCGPFDLLDLLVDGQMAQTGIPGLAAAIVADGRVAWSKGYGMADVAAQRPVTTGTPFMLASVSKVVTSTAVMMVIEEGGFSLGTPVNQILDFTIDNPRVSGETITLFHLLTHTSGIDDWCVWGEIDERGAPYVSGDSPKSLGDYMRRCLTPGTNDYDPIYTWRNFLPGTKYLYSNIGNALAGYALERVVPGSFDDWSDTNIFVPLGMDRAGWHLADHDVGELAVPYSSTGGRFDVYPHYGFPDYPNGQLRTSVDSLARFLAAIARGGELDGTRVLSSANVDLMLTRALPGVDADQALGWFHTKVGDREVVGHDGGDFGVSTEMWLDRATGVGVIVLLNVDGTSANAKAMRRIEEVLFDLGEGF